MGHYEKLLLNHRKLIFCHTSQVYLLNKLNAGSQVHTEVNELPDNALLLVLLLLQDEHGVVEELLQFLIGEVDAQLLHTVVLIENISLENVHPRRPCF